MTIRREEPSKKGSQKCQSRPNIQSLENELLHPFVFIRRGKKHRSQGLIARRRISHGEAVE